MADYGLDKIVTEADESDQNPVNVPHRNDVDIHKNSMPGSTVNEGEFVAYDREGDLYLIKGGVVENYESAEWISSEMAFEVGGFYSSEASEDLDQITGDSLARLARNNLEESPERVIEDFEGYGVVE